MIRADAHRQHGVASRSELDPTHVSRAVSEYLAVLDDAAFGAAIGVAPKFVSPVDPAARDLAVFWSARGKAAEAREVLSGVLPRFPATDPVPDDLRPALALLERITTSPGRPALPHNAPP
jgi:hypothetical protein